MGERREFIRTVLNAKVMVRHHSIGQEIYQTGDISDGGIYVIVESGEFPPIGSEVEVQVQGLPEEAPVLTMKVVRRGSDGYGLCFM